MTNSSDTLLQSGGQPVHSGHEDGSDIFQIYCAVRQVVDYYLRQRARDISGYWAEELRSFRYIFDAPADVVRTLRCHAYHITGDHPYTYLDNPAMAALYAAKKRALEKLGGADLPFRFEDEDLGGFGFEIDGGKVNIDRLKYYEVFVALKKMGVLEALRDPDHRNIICEIGSGWGGICCDMKERLPNSTMILVDLPELFIFSATYLLHRFPGARIAYIGHDQDFDWSKAADYDFILVPHYLVGAVRPPYLDLALNTVSFQEMTTEQVREYVMFAADRKARFIYSLNREQGPYNPEITCVSEIISEGFEVSEYPVLAESYTQFAAEFPSDHKGRPVPPKEGVSLYRHLLGRPRADAVLTPPEVADDALRADGAEAHDPMAVERPEGAPDMESVVAWHAEAAAKVKQAAAAFPPAADCSDTWKARRAGAGYLASATPAILDTWFHHLFHANGPWRYAYRSHKPGPAEAIRKRHDGAIKSGLLRGRHSLPRHLPDRFGFPLKDGMANEDTVRSEEMWCVLNGMGGLGRLAPGADPSFIVEVGPAWGCFAHYAKKLYPGTTAVVMDYPEFLLISAVQIARSVPGARIHIVTDPAERVAPGTHDFVLVPFGGAQVLDGPVAFAAAPDGFGGMTDAEAAWILGDLNAAGCPVVISRVAGGMGRPGKDAAGLDTLGAGFRFFRKPVVLKAVTSYEADYERVTQGIADGKIEPGPEHLPRLAYDHIGTTFTVGYRSLRR